MMKKFKEKNFNLYGLYPTIPCIVLVKFHNKINGLSIAWHTLLSGAPPLYGICISPKRYSYEMIKEAKEFTVNFIPFEKSFLLAVFGRISGREMDKIKVFNVELSESKIIKTPILKDSFISYECILRDEFETGDHFLFVGEIVGSWEDENFFEEGLPNLKVYEPCFYLGKDIYAKAKFGFLKQKISREEIDKILKFKNRI
jgi:flavin reductase (DIM6/NTAB) family NADH-FMN oxidoreductase RutF